MQYHQIPLRALMQCHQIVCQKTQAMPSCSLDGLMQCHQTPSQRTHTMPPDVLSEDPCNAIRLSIRRLMQCHQMLSQRTHAVTLDVLSEDSHKPSYVVSEDPCNTIRSRPICLRYLFFRLTPIVRRAVGRRIYYEQISMFVKIVLGLH